MAHSKNGSKGDLYLRDVLSHIDGIIAGQGKVEGSISFQLLVASQEKHIQCDVVVVVLCMYS